MPEILEGHRGGETYEADRDFARLNAQHRRVYEAMDEARWMTLHQVSAITGDPEASISARLRDFRKKEYGNHYVGRHYMGDGLWEYLLIWNPEVTRPEEENNA